MKKTLFTVGILLSCLISFAWATPPSSIDLNYDAEKGNLHIEIAHAAHDPHQHHIRKVEVSVNDQKATNLYFATQTTPASLIIDLPLQAKGGDRIRVLAICSEAGRREETLIVPEKDKDSPAVKAPPLEKKSKDVLPTHQSSY